MKCQAKFDCPRVPAGEEFTVRLMLSAAPEGPSRQIRQPFNLAVVLDRSGSMSGHKIKCVKEAVRKLVGQLGEQDWFSLTVFDDAVDVVQAPVAVREGGRAIQDRIARIHTGGSTNLAGGYERGGDLAMEHLREGHLSRVLLLTDGLANVGPDRPADLGRMAAGLLEKGVGTSTFGVGEGYHEEMLAEIARHGGGSKYFLHGPEEAEAVFAEEFSDLAQVYATGFRVRFVPETADLQVESMNSYAEEGTLAWRIGDLFGERPRHLVLEIRGVAPGAAGTPFAVGRMEVCWRPVGSESGPEETLTLPIALEVATREELAGFVPDPEVTLQAAFLTAAAVLQRAIQLADQRDWTQAGELLENCARQLEELQLRDEGLDRQIAELRERARRLVEERESFYDRSSRKRMFTEREMMSSGKMAKLDLMRERQDLRRGRSAMETYSYPCYSVDGHLLVEIGDDRALLASLLPRTLGLPRTRPFVFVDRPHAIETGPTAGIVEELGRAIGHRITVLLGSDLLGIWDYRIDLEAGMLLVSEPYLDLRAPIELMSLRQSLPLLPADWGDSLERPFLFDCASALSYLPADRLEPLPVMGTTREYVFGVGPMTFEVREVPLRVAGHEFPLRCSVLPPTLDPALRGLGAKGIIGSELCRRARLTFSPRRRKAAIEPR